MKAWRITSARYAERAFDGEGARRFGGRWNLPGTALVYASETLSLAALEYFVQLDPDLAPPKLVWASAEIPADVPIGRLEVAELPGNWRHYPAPEQLRLMGTQWAGSMKSVLLSVPSTVIPQEANFLINPAHPDFQKVIVHSPEPFSFDPRMWK